MEGIDGVCEICKGIADEEDGASDGPLTRRLSPGRDRTMTKGRDPLALPWLRVHTFRSTACEPGETGGSLRFDPARRFVLPNGSPCDFFATFGNPDFDNATKSSASEHFCRWCRHRLQRVFSLEFLRGGGRNSGFG